MVVLFLDFFAWIFEQLFMFLQHLFLHCETTAMSKRYFSPSEWKGTEPYSDESVHSKTLSGWKQFNMHFLFYIRKLISLSRTGKMCYYLFYLK